MKKQYFLLILILASIFVVIINWQKKNEKLNLFSPQNQYKFIAHAGGKINNAIYTNSKEALENALKKGYKLIEIDLLVSTDSKLVAAHDWKQFHDRTGFSGGTPVTLNEFLLRKIDGKFTPVDGAFINDFFGKHKDLILVTDKIKDFDLLLKEYEHHNRLIVEVFSVEDYKKALNKGIKYPAFCVWTAENIPVVIQNNIKIITTPMKSIMKSKENYMELYNRGVTILAFTENNRISAEKYSPPVSIYYTDILK